MAYKPRGYSLTYAISVRLTFSDISMRHGANPEDRKVPTLPIRIEPDVGLVSKTER